jgi:hypothetical protein
VRRLTRAKTAAIITTGVALLWAAPASADPQHTSCRAFGQGTAAAAHALGGLGGFVGSINTGPGAVAGAVAAFQEGVCEKPTP